VSHRILIGLALLVVVVAGTASAQDPLTNAKRVANKAAAATNAHIDAEQHPEAQPQQAAAPTTPAAAQTAQAAHSPRPPVRTLTIAQKDTTVPPTVVMRETFDYSASGRRDPFVSLLSTNELRPTMSDLRLTGILYDHVGGHSVATLRDLGTNAQYRVTLGSALGRMRVAAIRTKTILFTIEEFGSSRQDSLVLGDSTKARVK
jgi:Tfp pilus assembly protein PilP